MCTAEAKARRREGMVCTSDGMRCPHAFLRSKSTGGEGKSEGNIRESTMKQCRSKGNEGTSNLKR